MLKSPMGHDATNQWICVRQRFARLHPNEEYGCVHCGGEGSTFRDDAHRAAHDAWEKTEPPQGEGYQMWENTSEGSPLSPVFDTPEKLAGWLYETNASSFGSDGASYTAWLQMIKGSGWAPSMIVQGGQPMSGVEAGVDPTKPSVALIDNSRPGPHTSVTFEANFPDRLQDDAENGPLALIEWCKGRDIHTTRFYQTNGMVMVRGTLTSGHDTVEFRLRW